MIFFFYNYLFYSFLKYFVFNVVYEWIIGIFGEVNEYSNYICSWFICGFVMGYLCK